jgi:hypothetical protein
VSRTGQPYTAHGWKTTMYKIVRAAIADPTNALEQPFSFHHFRARSATDEEEIYGTNPQHRLGHKRRSTTEIYLRGKRVKRAKRVKPLPLAERTGLEPATPGVTRRLAREAKKPFTGLFLEDRPDFWKAQRRRRTRAGRRPRRRRSA